jgi:hypothetical protein
MNNLLGLGYVKQNKLILFMDKKDEKLWMCIGFWAFNKITIKNNYPFTRIDNLSNWFKRV